MSAKIPRLGGRERQSNLVRPWGHTSVHWLQRAAEHDRLGLVEEEGGMVREQEAGRWSHPPWNLSSISPIGDRNSRKTEILSVLFTAVYIALRTITKT